MGFLDKAKQAAEQATSKAKEGIGELQTRRDLGEAYDELGKLTFDLAESGEIADERLAPLLERIRELKATLETP